MTIMATTSRGENRMHTLPSTQLPAAPPVQSARRKRPESGEGTPRDRTVIICSPYVIYVQIPTNERNQQC